MKNSGKKDEKKRQKIKITKNREKKETKLGF